MPRILTNKQNLPLPLYLAIKNDTYEARGDISTTTLIDHPYIRILRKYNQYEEDAAENIWALYGQAVHSVIERVGQSFNGVSFLPEEKLLIKTSGVEFQKEVEVSGTADLVEIQQDGTVILHDFKNIFVWTAKQGSSSSSFDKWTKQLNIYTYMLNENRGLVVSKIYVHAFIRDWNRNKSERDINYPNYPVETFEIPRYNNESILKYIRKRIDLHFIAEEKYRKGEFDSIEHCDKEDRWARPTTWRMVNAGKKRSIKNFVINDDADVINATAYFNAKSKENKDLIIDVVAGEDVRCVNYCPVSSHCNYYKKTYGEKAEESKVGEGADGDIQGTSPNKEDELVLDF